MYSPRLKKEQIELLYLVAKRLKVPMTKIVRDAVDLYLKKLGTGQGSALVSKQACKGNQGVNNEGKKYA